jgi:3-phenylpropionate/trans-cinnamate dioxygenase ferredoxin reductase component
VRVDEIHRASRTLTINGAALQYDALILATGSRPRPLPSVGTELSGIHQLRTLGDTDALKTEIRSGRRLLVVGGGYIGLEVAASARARGAEVVLLEREKRCMARVACPQISEFFESYHRARGVDIRTGTRIARFTGAPDGAVRGIELEGGEVIPCNVALVGIGVQPCEELAVAAGIACNDGILVDIDARTSDPHIFAVGDVTRRPIPAYNGRLFRLESVANAAEQAKQAAAAISGQSAPQPEVPWFWSDQYDLKLQIAGIAHQTDEIIARGDTHTTAFSMFHLKNRRVIAVESVNAALEFMIGRRLIAAQVIVDPESLANSEIPMKQILESSSRGAALTPAAR